MLWQIALRYGTTAGSLIRANDIPNPDALRIGMRLRIPNGRAQPQTPSIACPVRGAEFVNDFGVPRPGGRVHDGIDLFAPRGTPVRAPASGWVAAWVGDIGGRQVRLIGDDGHYYSSSHLSAFGAGGWVEGGTVIGYVGNTGNAKGSPPHVHFEFHRNGGAAVNPYGMLVRACG
jgi:murein DD-endopeptidase MepM/ murein hydrolase activator NlpD